MSVYGRLEECDEVVTLGNSDDRLALNDSLGDFERQVIPNGSHLLAVPGVRLAKPDGQQAKVGLRFPLPALQDHHRIGLEFVIRDGRGSLVLSLPTLGDLLPELFKA